MDEIPVIDVKGLSEKEEDLLELATQIKDAFTNTGFVAIVNHNIENNTVCMYVGFYRISKLIKPHNWKKKCRTENVVWAHDPE